MGARSSPLLLILLHLILFASAYYFIRYHIRLNGGGRHLHALCSPSSQSRLALYTIPLLPQNWYNKFCYLSEFFLAVLFSGASARSLTWDLLSAFALPVAVIYFEAVRPGRSILVAVPAVYGIAYHLLGAGFILQIYFLAFLLTSSSHTKQRSIPCVKAEGVLFALVFGYLLPTVVMFLSSNDSYRVVAFWQLFPILMSLLYYGYTFLRPLFSVVDPSKSSYGVVQLTYFLTLAFPTFAHLQILFSVIKHPDTLAELYQIYIPSIQVSDPLTTTLEASAVQLLKWDGIFTFGSTLFAGFYSLHQLGRFQDHLYNIVTWFQVALALPVLGPGAVMAAVWMAREIALKDLREGELTEEEFRLKASKGPKTS